MKGLVSIIMPCYNAAELIGESIQSVMDQTFSDWELIIIDDQSTDSSLDVVSPFAERDQRIRLIRLPVNQGVAAARNEGIRRAQGKYITFLDSDDLWDVTKLERQVKFLQENDYDICHAAYRRIDFSGQVLSPHIPVSEQGVSYRSLLKHNEIGCLTMLYDAEKIGKYYFKNIGHEDFACWLEILKPGRISYGINTVLASYRIHSNTLSSNKITAARYTWHIFRYTEGLGLVQSIYYFFHYAINSSLKHFRR